MKTRGPARALRAGRARRPPAAAGRGLPTAGAAPHRLTRPVAGAAACGPWPSRSSGVNHNRLKMK